MSQPQVSSDKTTADILYALGVVFHISGCVGTSLGLCLQKAAHIALEGSDIPYYKSKKMVYRNLDISFITNFDRPGLYVCSTIRSSAFTSKYVGREHLLCKMDIKGRSTKFCLIIILSSNNFVLTLELS